MESDNVRRVIVGSRQIGVTAAYEAAKLNASQRPRYSDSEEVLSSKYKMPFRIEVESSQYFLMDSTGAVLLSVADEDAQGISELCDLLNELAYAARGKSNG